MHIPVMATEVMEALALAPGMTVLDGTLGLGGHASLIIEKTGPNGRLIGFDADDRNLALARERLHADAERVTFIHDSYARAAAHDLPPLDAALLDLGFSSVHVDDPARGFSFLHDGPLDMRYDMRQERTAATIVNGATEDELAEILRVYGEEPNARRIAETIVRARKEQQLTTTGDLAALIATILPRRGKTHPATRTFQALRIAVNDELGALEEGLKAITALLRPGAHFAVLTFHSLEDRVVKRFFAEAEDLELLTKKPLLPSREEIVNNPRARSAKLRTVQKRTYGK